MAPISSLPTELLINFFSDENLNHADLASCQQVCKRFYDIAKSLKFNYTFQVDHVNQSSWKLIKHLLANPALGGRFKEINITWHRRRVMKPRTWVKKWEWTEEEKDQIQEFASEWLHPKTIPAILAGLNSEALLPLLLCYTINLESLDVGDSTLGIIQTSPTARDGIRIYRYGVGDDSMWQPRRPYSDGWDLFDRFWRSSVPIDTNGDRKSWLHVNIDNGKKIPGLWNIRRFSHGYGIPTNRITYYRGWPAGTLVKVLLLPQLEYLHASQATAIDYTPLNPVDSRTDNSLRSNVKHLELVDCLLRSVDYESIAKVTSSLEYFRCTLIQKLPTEAKGHSNWGRHTNDASEINVEAAFLQHNKDTLQRSHTFLKRSVYVDEVYYGREDDINYGEDDDPSYYAGADFDEDWIND
ncbi:hypothetical protein H072_3393 [Dactylellina haptotyla CBS 200.50]|uniref:F-box domain-containing protein n=1 Tax=Dactylellina haptotyla (strain CBS 200.50) TaxID=1284197 RepID=S8AHT8_DACHA|nr:hypothetical protein H072_3393 [Dactylellina haptotyla CBS 200.50]